MLATRLLPFLILLPALLYAGNKTIHISYIPVYNGKQVVFEEQYYPLPGADSVAFDVFKMYISHITFYHAGSEVFTENESHLLQLHTGQHTIHLDMPAGTTYDEIRFDMGIDSATNVAGALSGDLDPANGMYWAWQSGYINVKLEGRSNICPTRNHEFSFHLGGYMPPGYAMQHIALKSTDSNINIHVQLDSFLNQTNLHQQNTVMIPGAEAVELAKKLANTFILTAR